MKIIDKMIKVKLFVFFIFLSTQILAQQEAKNIILFIGDGMGVTQVYGAMVVNKAPLNLERFKYIGFIKTQSANKFNTDSGAGGTALACGKKSYSGAIGVDVDKNPLQSILKIAKENGKSVGIVAACAATHATPAAFVANNISRNNQEEIALDYIRTGVDVVIAGGSDFFMNRKDNLNLGDSLLSQGYTFCTDLDACCLQSETFKLYCLTHPKHPPAVSQRGDYLSVATERAIQILSKNPNGFFLMVEGSQIDWAGHKRKGDLMIAETIDFDKAIGTALHATGDLDNTLIIVTADHETGGMSIKDGDLREGRVKTRFSTNYHTGVMVPVFAMGPMAELFIGIYENTEIFQKMLDAYGFKK